MNNNNNYYVARSLESQELDDWFNFVTFVFQIPKQYFMNHYYNDPTSTVRSIFVAVDNQTNAIIGSVRVFERYLYLKNQIVKVEAIGEVATHPDHRKKGIASTLLRKAVQYMSEYDYVLSALHTTCVGTAGVLYKNLGWNGVNLDYVSISVQTNGNHAVKQEVINYDNELVVQALSKMYDDTCKRLKLDGTMVRSADYWRKWIHAEAGKNGVMLLNDKGEPSAYAVIKKQDNGEYKLMDFGVHSDCNDVWNAFKHLAPSNTIVTVPKPIVKQFGQKRDGMIIHGKDQDQGVMYKAVTPGQSNAYLQNLQSSDNHLLWGLDFY
jgi:ribosomal protein S18 acetylase RimI-like enzyme